MPEGPEVYEYYKYLKEQLTDEIVYNISFISGKYIKKQPENYNKLLNNLPSKITDIKIKGKNIFILLNNKYTLLFTHGMTGFWSNENHKHSRISLNLSKENSDKKIYFIDQRNFGKFTILSSNEEFEQKLDYFGPDILDSNINEDIFFSRINKKKRAKIGTLLLEQKIICGIGNYLRCDILWMSKISPETKIKDLSLKQRNDLYYYSKNICMYYAGFENTLDITPEHFNRDTFIYMQDTDPYGNSVIKSKMGSRTLHYVNWEFS